MKIKSEVYLNSSFQLKKKTLRKRIKFKIGLVSLLNKINKLNKI